MNATEYDPAALDALIGLTPSTESTSQTLRLNADDQQALGKLAGTPAPGVTAPATAPAAPAGEVPDYLKAFVPKPPDTPPVAPVPVDWKKEMQTLTGQVPEGDVSQENFEREMVKRQATANFLNQNPAVENYYNLVNDKVEPIKAIQDSVTTAFKKMGITAPSVINGQLSEFIEEGELTPAGTARYAELKREAATELNRLQTDAGTYAEGRAKALDDYYGTFPKLATDFTFLGIPFDEGEMQQLQADIRSGASDDWWNNSATPYEAALKDHWKAFIKNQVMFFDKSAQFDERSQKYGQTKALGRRL